MSKRRKKSDDMDWRHWTLIGMCVLLALLGVKREFFDFPSGKYAEWKLGYEAGCRETTKVAVRSMRGISRLVRDGKIPCKPGECHFHPRVSKKNSGYCCFCGRVTRMDFSDYMTVEGFKCGPFFPIDP